MRPGRITVNSEKTISLATFGLLCGRSWAEISTRRILQYDTRSPKISPDILVVAGSRYCWTLLVSYALTSSTDIDRANSPVAGPITLLGPLTIISLLFFNSSKCLNEI